MSVCIIPARGGSKRIYKKNIKLFNDHPIISYSIKIAKESGCFDRVIVSTDDKEIADVSKKYGAEVPFIRPKELSGDFTSTAEVMLHAIEFLNNESYKFDLICCLYPTAPLCDYKDIIKAHRTLIENEDCSYCFPVCEFPSSIHRALRYENGKTAMFYPKNFNIRTQDLEKAYYDAGQFYWGKKNAYIKNIRMFSSHSIMLLTDRKRVIDIDTEDDWEMAELLFNLIK